MCLRMRGRGGDVEISMCSVRIVLMIDLFGGDPSFQAESRSDDETRTGAERETGKR